MIGTKVGDKSLPISLYDVFGYLLPGILFALLVFYFVDGPATLAPILRSMSERSLSTQSFDSILAQGSHRLLSVFVVILHKSPWFITVLCLVFAYVVGHVLSAASSLFLEAILLKGLAGDATLNLFHGHPEKHNWIHVVGRAIRRVFVPEEYTERYTEGFWIELNDCLMATFRLELRDKSVDSHRLHEIYWLTESYLTQVSPAASARIMHFLNLYGFNRNFAMAVLVALFLSLIIDPMDTASNILRAVALLGYVALFRNYVRLYRRTVTELYYSLYSYVRGIKTFTSPLNAAVQPATKGLTSSKYTL